MVNALERNEETVWDDCLECGNQCIYELHQMSRSSTRTYKADAHAKFQVVTPAFERAIRAIPHVKLMNRAVRRKDRTTAIESGRAAIAEMNGTSASRLPALPVAATNGNGASAGSPEKPAPAHARRKTPARVAKRTPARVMAGTSR